MPSKMLWGHLAYADEQRVGVTVATVDAIDTS